MTLAEVETNSAIAFRMHEEGAAFSEIGRALMVSRQRAQQLVIAEQVRIGMIRIREVTAALRAGTMNKFHAANKIDGYANEISREKK